MIASGDWMHPLGATDLEEFASKRRHLLPEAAVSQHLDQSLAGLRETTTT